LGALGLAAVERARRMRTPRRRRRRQLHLLPGLCPRPLPGEARLLLLRRRGARALRGCRAARVHERRRHLGRRRAPGLRRSCRERLLERGGPPRRRLLRHGRSLAGGLRPGLSGPGERRPLRTPRGLHHGSGVRGRSLSGLAGENEPCDLLGRCGVELLCVTSNGDGGPACACRPSQRANRAPVAGSASQPRTCTAIPLPRRARRRSPRRPVLRFRCLPGWPLLRPVDLRAGTRCRRSLHFSRAVRGRCLLSRRTVPVRSPTGEGEPCADGACAPPAHCDYFLYVCTAPGNLDDPCFVNGETDPCDAAADLYCSTRCTLRGGLGASCDGSDQCEPGLRCDFGISSAWTSSTW